MHLLELPVPTPDLRIAYGQSPSQFGDLWLPEAHGGASVPVVAFFHGGWWKSEYDLGYAGHLCRALTHAGIAAWSVEYRRVGHTGGGWPQTFQDASTGFDFLSTLAADYPLDLSRVVTAGHSAGGHLAFWVAGRARVPAASELLPAPPLLAPTGALSLAGAVDLRAVLAGGNLPGFLHVDDRISRLMGGFPDDLPQRYAEGDPGALRPLPVPQVLIQGSEDDQIPPGVPDDWLAASQAAGNRVSVRIVPGADHFDVVDPRSSAWPVVLAAVRSQFEPA